VGVGIVYDTMRLEPPAARLRFAIFKTAAALAALTRSQRAVTARRADSRRSFADIAAARALPPFRPIAESTALSSFARALPPLLRIRVAVSM